MNTPADQDHRGRVHMLLPPGTALRLRFGAVRPRLDGHLRRRVRRPLDRFLGTGRTHVDIRLQKRVQGYQAHARVGTVHILEGELHFPFLPFRRKPPLNYVV